MEFNFVNLGLSSSFSKHIDEIISTILGLYNYLAFYIAASIFKILSGASMAIYRKTIPSM